MINTAQKRASVLGYALPPRGALPDGNITRGDRVRLTGLYALTDLFPLSLTGTIPSAGALTKSALRSLTGQLSLSGGAIKAFVKALTGALGLSGGTIKITLRALVGSVSFAGLATSVGGIIDLLVSLVGEFKKSFWLRGDV